MIIPVWIFWLLANLCAVLLLAWFFYDRLNALRLRHAAELQTREAYHLEVCTWAKDEILLLKNQLADHATLWLVGRHVRGDHWDVQGIFAEHDAAVAACKNARYFLFALTLDEELPEESATPFALEYPKGAE